MSPLQRLALLLICLLGLLTLAYYLLFDGGDALGTSAG